MATAAECLGSYLSSRGMDICTSFSAQWYNEYIIAEGLQSKLSALETFNRGSTQAWLIGNTRALWSPLIDWNEDKMQQGLNSANPIDEYCQEMIEGAVNRSYNPDTRKSIHWTWTSDPALLVSMQRVAEVSGLCFMDKVTHLCVHPVFGTWCGFRAVVVIDADCPDDKPDRIECMLSEDERRASEELLNRALLAGNEGYRQSSWRAWLAMRDAIQTGKEYRYGENQLAYHYTGDRVHLQRD